jgi:DNA-directed RNA polymerase
VPPDIPFPTYSTAHCLAGQHDNAAIEAVFNVTGITFAGVHDSFWTHASTTPIMNRLLREKFVELYSQPILEDLHASFLERYPDAKIPPLPEKGDLDIREVLDSEYFFS